MALLPNEQCHAANNQRNGEKSDERMQSMRGPENDVCKEEMEYNESESVAAQNTAEG